MKGRYSFGVALVAVVFAGSVAMAADTVADAWTKVSPPSGTYTVETPCLPAEVEKFKQLPENFSKIEVPVVGRVICMKPDLILLSGEVIADGLPANGPALYDLIVDQAAKDPAPDGKPMQVTLNQRRAMVNREVSGQHMAQTGFIETGHDRIILIVTGFQPESKTPLAEQGKQIDRFFGSITVNAK